MDSKATQLKVLVGSGVALEDAALSLGLEIDAAMDFLNGEFGKAELSVEDFIASKKLRMAQILFEIANDPCGENIAARVSAAKVFIEGKGEMPEVPIDKISAYYKKVKDIQNKQLASETITTPSPSTSVVNINHNSSSNGASPKLPSSKKPQVVAGAKA